MLDVRQLAKCLSYYRLLQIGNICALVATDLPDTLKQIFVADAHDAPDIEGKVLRKAGDAAVGVFEHCVDDVPQAACPKTVLVFLNCRCVLHDASRVDHEQRALVRCDLAQAPQVAHRDLPATGGVVRGFDEEQFDRPGVDRSIRELDLVEVEASSEDLSYGGV